MFCKMLGRPSSAACIILRCNINVPASCQAMAAQFSSGPFDVKQPSSGPLDMKQSLSGPLDVKQSSSGPLDMKQSSSGPLDMKQIVKANKKKCTLDNLKKSAKQKVQKTHKLKVLSPQTETVYPDWLNVVLDSPLSPNDHVDLEKHQAFKEFVEELDLKYLPSVSTIIKKTESKKSQEILQKWQEAKTAELGGAQQFQEYQNEILNNGLNLHKCIELHLRGETDFVVSESNKGHWESVQSALREVKDIKLLELDCVHPEMFYRGKIDCVAVFRDTLCLIEWKTSSKLKPLLSATYDNPVQVAAYMGALNRSGLLKQYDIPRVTNGALVIAYPSGEPATVHMMSQKVCERYWRQWLTRLYSYWALQYEEKTED